jgi:hypothetical protein
MPKQLESLIESIMKKNNEKIHHHESSSSAFVSDLDEKSDPSESVKAKIWCLFGRERAGYVQSFETCFIQ